MRGRRLAAVTVFVVAVAGSAVAAAPAVAAGCTSTPVVCENGNAGSPQSEWEINGAGDPSVQGFATTTSVNVGDQVRFKVKASHLYKVDIYRVGWYGGTGARKVASVTPAAPQNQPPCTTDPDTEIFDCGTWSVSATWNVPATAVSGVYIAKLSRTDGAGASHIPFVVRDDSSHADLYFKTSDNTWQAYNAYGGSNFYVGAAHGRAYKLSFNRPITTRGDNSGRDSFFSSEYSTVRFLERNGYDVTYATDLDADRRGANIRNHRTFLSVGHDEYWSGDERANVEAARDAGVNLAFLSGNEVYWKTRWEPSQDGAGTSDRTMVCYKETWANEKLDPSPEWTGTWRDPRFSPPTNGGRPENGLTGTQYMSNSDDLALKVPAEQGRARLWRVRR
jgi:hypothetical protein